MIQTTLPTFFRPDVEEVCQPCAEFTKRVSASGKNWYWYCFCNKRANRCTNSACKEYGLKHGINVGGEICEHGRHKNTCKECGGSSVCKHGRQKSGCKRSEERV